MFPFPYSGSNNIEDKGCQFLAKAKWFFLEEINLGTADDIKATIKFKKRDANICLQANGSIYENYLFVFILQGRIKQNR